MCVCVCISKFQSFVNPNLCVIYQLVLAQRLSLFLLFVLVALGTCLDERKKDVKSVQFNNNEWPTAAAAAAAAAAPMSHHHPRRWKQYKVCSTIATNTCLSSAHLAAAADQQAVTSDVSHQHHPHHQHHQHHHNHFQIGQQKNPLVVEATNSQFSLSSASSSSSVNSTPICSATPSCASSELLTPGGRKGRVKRKSAAGEYNIIR